MTDNNGSGPKSSIEIPPEYLATTQSKLTIEQRIILARKEGAAKLGTLLTDRDQILINRILHIIALDAEERVRHALGDTLAENPNAPHDVVLRLALDSDLVASPLLRLSEILTPDDLVAIIESQTSSLKMEAIAGRREVPERVSLALIANGSESTAVRLLQNPGAAIPESGMHKIIDRYGKGQDVQIALIDRTSLPGTVMERIIAFVSSELLDRLVERHKMPAQVAAKIALETRARATLGLTAGMSSGALIELIGQIIAEGRFTESLLLRSLCMGNIEFLAHAIATRAHLSVGYVRTRLVSAVPADLEELWDSADLPAQLLPVACAAIEVVSDSQLDGAKWSVGRYRQRIVERMITRCDALNAAVSDEDFAFLMAASSQGTKESDDFVPGANTAHA